MDAPETHGDTPASTTSHSQERDEFQEGLRELEEFIRSVGSGRIQQPCVRERALIVPMRARDDVLYFLRVEAQNYLSEPPRCTFVDPLGRPGAGGWPARITPGNPTVFGGSPFGARHSSRNEKRFSSAPSHLRPATSTCG